MTESKNLEFIETVTNTFLKTVSAFANFGTGEIKFGVTDSGISKGIENADSVCLDIENRINDSISPKPQFTLSVNSNNAITLKVFEGLYKPYLYKAKAYRRSDTATIEVDSVELRRLLLEGQNLSFENLKAAKQELTFSVLERKMNEQFSLDNFDTDVLKTLELFSDKDGFNVAGEIVADENTFPGIDIVRFGNSIDIILDRETHEHISCLLQFDNALSMFRKYYQYEEIKGALRETVELIPEKAFREAVVNALVHRTWDVKSHIRISMFADKIEISSPGGLTHGITEEEYLNGRISLLRNPIIGNIFFRLHQIERFGTGVKRINEAYSESETKPQFNVNDNSITVILPVFRKDLPLSADEKAVYYAVKGKKLVPISEITASVSFSKSKVTIILKNLMDKGYVKAIGTGRGRKYFCD